LIGGCFDLFLCPDATPNFWICRRLTASEPQNYLTVIAQDLIAGTIIIIALFAFCERRQFFFADSCVMAKNMLT
jgi:hypothetical protein